MIEVNKNTLASALSALGKLVCRTSPLALCKSVKIEAAEGKLRLSTCGLNEEVSFELETGGEEVFCCLVGFDELRDAVRSGRNKTVGLTYEAGTLLVGDRYLITVKDVEWPDMSPKVEAPNCLLPDGIVNLFARAAQIVDRNEPRAILRGINLSSGRLFPCAVARRTDRRCFKRGFLQWPCREEKRRCFPLLRLIRYPSARGEDQCYTAA